MKKSKIIQYIRNFYSQPVSQAWLADGRESLQDFMRHNPVRNNHVERQSRQWVFLNHLILKPMPIAIFSIIASLVAGGGIVTASQSSLPNGALYPVKLLVENVRTIAVPDKVRKVELQIESANKRLQEIETMQSKGQATETIVKETLKNYQISLKRAKDYAAEINTAPQAIAAASGLVQAVTSQQITLNTIKEQAPKEYQAVVAATQVLSLDGPSQSLEVEGTKSKDETPISDNEVKTGENTDLDNTIEIKNPAPSSGSISVPTSGFISAPTSLPDLISEARAIEIASRFGLEKGISQWQTSLHWYEGDINNYVWTVSNSLSEFNGRTVVIDAHTGQVYQILGYQKTY